ncbi:hypothetical protein E2C01_049797 [Portunus trituberculatus]|uniref:Uncharacterized protein n=1 Tax=Portunus trituberculatus TaxID=210409 RepID=A0A5B7GAE9_PORTR|nr:hypothetical protein [Portunus trituberculatus]
MATVFTILILPHEFLKLYKSLNSNQNEYGHASWYLRG